MTPAIRPKWRPPLLMVVSVVCLTLVSVPVLALLSLRLTSNQFVRETEQSLITQAAIYAQVFADAFAAQGGPRPGPTMGDEQIAFWAETLHPWRPRLNLRHSPILPPLPDFDEQATVPEPGPRFQNLSEGLFRLEAEASGTTLAGAFFLDFRGVSLAQPQSFADASEVQAALRGEVGSALRYRGDKYNRHALASISRDTAYRVFVAYPVILDQQVIGVVYLSRTPSNLAKFAVTERDALLTMLGATVLSAGFVGWLLMRLVAGPIHALSRQSREIAKGESEQHKPLTQYGVKELASLGQNMMRMAKTLHDRSQQITTYTNHVTHELKAPVTVIQGAAELLDSPDIAPPTRHRLQANILSQTRRMTALLEKLRHMTRLQDAPTTGEGKLIDMVPDLPDLRITITNGSTEVVPMLPEHGEIVLQQLARNAAEAGATELWITHHAGRLEVCDNGHGIPDEVQHDITAPFFTTRRDSGGTGLGLAIVMAILQNYHAQLRVEPAAQGAKLVIVFDPTDPVGRAAPSY